MAAGIATVVGVKLYASRRFVRIKDFVMKSAPVNLVIDACLIILLLTFIFEKFYSKYDIAILILFVILLLAKLLMRSHYFSGLRHDFNIKYGFRSDYILTEGKIPFVYYNQGDCRWRDEPYCGHGMTLEYTGCGPTAFAMAAATLLGDRTVTPVKIAGLAKDIGLNRRGTEYEFMKTAAKSMDIPVKLYDTKYWDETLEEVKNGKLAIAVIYVRENLFHYVIIRHVFPDGKILVADPCNFADSIKPKKDSSVRQKLHDEPLPTLCVLG